MHLATDAIGYASSFGLAFALSLAATFLVRQAARRYGLVAKPRADRWHKKPTALFGGVGIFVGFLVAYFVRRPEGVSGGNLMLLCAAGMFLVGLVDDFVQLKPYAKLVGQILFATLFTTFGMRLHWLQPVPLDQALTIFWLVGITNAINLLDNLDGLAGGVSAIAALYLVYFCHAAGSPALATTTAAFAGAIVGFLVLNFNPASIFMGDCGSLFLGFFLGGVSLVDNQVVAMRRNILSILTLPVLLLLIPIVDTTLVTVSRKLAGRAVSQGGRDHTSHRLVALGLSERAAALTLWTFAAISGAIAVTVRNLPWQVGALVVPAFGLLLTFFVIYLGRVRVYAPVENEAEGKGRALIPTLADFTYKRRIFEVLHDVVIILLAYYAAFLLRFDGHLTEPYYHRMVESLPVVLAVQLVAFLVFGLYRGLWRYTSLQDLPILFRAVVGGWLATMVALGFLWRFSDFSRGALLMDVLLLGAAIGGSRISFRLIRVWMMRFSAPRYGRRVLIYGAGDGGELLLRELQNNHELGMLAIGFVDDDPQKRGRMIHGVRVLGTADELSSMVGAHKVDELVISTGKLAEDKVTLIARLCGDAGIQMRRLRIALE